MRALIRPPCRFIAERWPKPSKRLGQTSCISIWLSFALQQRKALDAFDLPVTIRVHGFEFTPDAMKQAFQWKQVRALYGIPHHVAASGIGDLRLLGIPSAFDTELSTAFRKGP